MSSPAENLPKVASKRPRPDLSPIQLEQSAGSQPQHTPHEEVTPRVPRHPMNANQPQMRDKIADHNRHEIVQVKWSAFKKRYLPHFPSDNDLDGYMERVASRRVTKYCPKVLEATSESPSGYSWVEFTPQIQKTVGQREGLFYEPLGSACDAIAATLAKGRHKRRKFKFVLHPDRANISSIAGGTNKIDGYFHATDEDKKYIDHVTSVAICAEFKLKSTQDRKVENRKQIVADAHFILNDDPRRMFTFGITIEGAEFCLWYFSRSHVAKSTRLHWMGADIRQFFGVLVAFTFAEPEDLGYDPTITLIRRPTQSFVYEIKDEEAKKTRFFKTTKSISEFRHTCITGRATRVWKAVEVSSEKWKETDETGESVVLKDVWLDESAETERSIQRQIFAGIEEFKGRMDNDPAEFKELEDADFQERIVTLLRDGDYKAHFLSIVAEAVAPSSHNISALLASGEAKPLPDLLHKPIPPAPNPPSNPNADQTRSLHSFVSTQDSQVQWSQQEISKNTSSRTYSAKKRYRIVFEEVGEAVHCKDSFNDVAKTMEGAVLALFLLFAAGWVHRDISTGNVLWYKPPGGDARGILSDLEYARRYPHNTGSVDPKTGTPIFMPGEVTNKEYLYFLKDVNPAQARPRAPKPTGSDSPAAKQTSPVISRPKIIVKHNFLHDLESCFWVFLFVLCHTRLPKDEDEFHKAVTNMLFSNDANSSKNRSNVLNYEDALKTQLDAYLDPALKHVIDATSTMVYNLTVKYKTILAPTDEQDVMAYKSKISSIFPFAYDMVTFIPQNDIPLLWRFRSNHAPTPPLETQKPASEGFALASGSRDSQKSQAIDNSNLDQHDTTLIPKRLRTIGRGASRKPPNAQQLRHQPTDDADDESRIPPRRSSRRVKDT